MNIPTNYCLIPSLTPSTGWSSFPARATRAKPLSRKPQEAILGQSPPPQSSSSTASTNLKGLTSGQRRQKTEDLSPAPQPKRTKEQESLAAAEALIELHQPQNADSE